METKAADVLDYWFGELGEDGSWDKRHEKIWFEGGPQVDAEIRERFGAALERAASGELDGWRSSPREALAFIVLCDQMSRNVWRGSARAFSLDERAYEVAQALISSGAHRGLHPIERAFVYMPLEHHEGIEAQEQCVTLFKELYEEVPEAQRELFQVFVDYAISHRDIIKRFGRYPHRNEVLGRETTEEERKWLVDGPRFGQ